MRTHQLTGALLLMGAQLPIRIIPGSYSISKKALLLVSRYLMSCITMFSLKGILGKHILHSYPSPHPQLCITMFALKGILGKHIFQSYPAPHPQVCIAWAIIIAITTTTQVLDEVIALALIRGWTRSTRDNLHLLKQMWRPRLL